MKVGRLEGEEPLLRGRKLTMVINHLLCGMIFQVVKNSVGCHMDHSMEKKWWLSKNSPKKHWVYTCISAVMHSFSLFSGYFIWSFGVRLLVREVDKDYDEPEAMHE